MSPPQEMRILHSLDMNYVDVCGSEGLKIIIFGLLPVSLCVYWQ